GHSLLEFFVDEINQSYAFRSFLRFRRGGVLFYLAIVSAIGGSHRFSHCPRKLTMKRFLSVVAALALLFGGVGQARASTLVVDFTSPGSENYYSIWNLGFQFHVN